MGFKPVIAVDPGLSGAVALYQQSDFDQLIIARDFKEPRQIAQAIAALNFHSRGRTPPSAAISVVEAVHAMPGQGVCSMFSFGKSTGVALGAFAALGVAGNRGSVHTDEVPPVQWQNWIKKTIDHGPARALAEKYLFKPDMSGFDSRIYALTCFPRHVLAFARAKDHNTADAVLMAVWQAWRDDRDALMSTLVASWCDKYQDTVPVPLASFVCKVSDRGIELPERLG